jgi:dinuclear metal center YbgI/SA1388 family protein
MTTKLRDILALLETIAPAGLAESWDNPGLQVGRLDQEITKILTALDPTLKAVLAASETDAQLLLTHHPLIFKPLLRLQPDTFPGDVLFEAAKRQVSVAALHTNLDVAPGGINDILADLLGLENTEALQASEGKDGAGLGRIGDLPEPADLAVVCRKIQKILGTGNIRVVGREVRPVRRLAVVGGSGGSLLSVAFEKGADLFLTGDVGHHAALEAESLGVAVVDGGHFRTEKAAFEVFSRRLEETLMIKGWNITVEINEEEMDPMGTVG